VPRRLAPWLAHHPSVHVELKERTSVDIVRAVRAGLAEAGIVSDAVAPVGVHPQPVAKSDLVVIAPAEHRLAGRLTTRLADVVGEAFVGMAPGTAMQKYLDEKACATGHSLRMRVQIKTFEGICEMVSHGIGLGIIPKEVARRNQRRQGYRILHLNDDWARRRLCLCFGEWAELSPSMRDLLFHFGATPPDSSRAHEV
jgi:DNA-binding transcriptional LysR family regulator